MKSKAKQSPKASEKVGTGVARKSPGKKGAMRRRTVAISAGRKAASLRAPKRVAAKRATRKAMSARKPPATSRASKTN